MKKQFWKIAVLILMLAIILCACETAPENEDKETTAPTESIVETTEPGIELDPEWLSENAIDEAVSYLFPLEEEKNVALAQEILLPLVESGNAEAQYYWGYIYDWEIVDNNGDEETESLYWYELALEQDFPKAYLAAALNEYIDFDERAKFIEAAEQAGIFEQAPEELGADGCAFIGIYYSLQKDYNTALDWYLKASDMGSTLAMLQIGLMYYDGIGVEQDYIASSDWLLKAANLGDINAMYWYGYALSRDEVATALIKHEYSSALDGYQKAADAGDPVAMYNIGKMYEEGYGLSRDTTTALEWYREAANAGYANAMYKMGSIYEEGYLVAANFEMAMDWYRKAAEAGYADAMHKMGSIYKEGSIVATDYELALEWYEKAADAGNDEAMLDIGYMYEIGLYVEQNESTARKWYTKAFAARETESIEVYSEKGKILNVAMEWYQKAAEAGHAVAMNNIGYLSGDGRGDFYEIGQHYTIDHAEVTKWYQEAADAGSSTAMYNLGYIYKKGSYVQQNYDTAMEWFIKAYANGYDGAAKQINEMLSNKQGLNAYFKNYGELISVKP